MNFNESTETNLCDAHANPSSHKEKQELKKRKREREKETEKENERFAIAPSHLIGDGSRHRVGPRLARIKGGFKTSAKHQSSNQGTAATMRAFVVSSATNFSFLRFHDPLFTISSFFRHFFFFLLSLVF